MEIKLKNISHNQRLSQETEAFTANIYINNTHAGFVRNQGKGGSTDIIAKDERGKVLIEQAEEYCKSLPPILHRLENGSGLIAIDMNLNNFVDKLLNEFLQAKEDKKYNTKLKEAMKRGLVFGIVDHSFSLIEFNRFNTILADPRLPLILKDAVSNSDVLNILNDGKKVLNTNIPEAVLRYAGFTGRQYVEPDVLDVTVDIDGMVKNQMSIDEPRGQQR